METSVKLQNMFHYSLIPMFAVIAVIMGILLFIIICAIVKKIKSIPPKQPKPIVVEKKTVNVAETKQNYLDRLRGIETAYNNGECTVRNAYQEMSAIIRGFVQDMTGIKVQNCTLQDIKGLRMPVLEELITEYYSPEFAQNSEGDVLASIHKTWGAIERWS